FPHLRVFSDWNRDLATRFGGPKGISLAIRFCLEQSWIERWGAHNCCSQSSRGKTSGGLQCNSETLCCERNASDRLPLLEDFALTRFPVSQIGERDNERLNTENHCSVVGEIYVNAVVIGCGGEFDAFNSLARGLWKARGVCVLLWRFVNLISHLMQFLCMSEIVNSVWNSAVFVVGTYRIPHNVSGAGDEAR